MVASVAADTKADLSLDSDDSDDSDDRTDFAEPGCNSYRPAWYGKKNLLKIQAVTGSKWMYFFKQSVIWPTKNLIMRTRFHFSNDPTY